MKQDKYKSLLDRAKELREAAIVNATKQVLEETADEHRKLIYEKLNRNASKRLNENIYEDDEESALDKMLSGGDAVATPPAATPTPDATATPTPDATAMPDATLNATGAAPDVTNDVNIDAMNVSGEEGMGTEEPSDEEKIDPKDVLALTDEDIKDLGEDKLRELISVLLDAYQNEEISVPEGEDSDVSLEIPENGEEQPSDEAGGMQGDGSGELDAALSAPPDINPEEGQETTGIEDLLSGEEDEEDKQGTGLSLESRLLKRQKQLQETVRKKAALMSEDADILLQDDDELVEVDNSLQEENKIMNSKLKNLKNKLINEIQEQKQLMTEERSEKTLNESIKRKIQKKLTLDESDKPKNVEKLREQNELLRNERDIYFRRLKNARQKLQERDEKLDKIENELDGVTNYTLRYSYLQKLFTNNPIVRRMNESQKEEVIDIIDSVKGLPKAEAKKKLDEIYREFQQETRTLLEGQNQEEEPTKKPLNENRKRSVRRGDVKPVLDSNRRTKREAPDNLFESLEYKRMLEIADIPDDESED